MPPVTSATTRFSRALETIASDGILKTDEWTADIAPRLAELPPRANDGGRDLVRLWARVKKGEVGIETPIAGLMIEALQRMGYPARADVEADTLIRENVTEADPIFEKLANLTGAKARREVIAVVDSGFWAKHEALKDRFWTNPGEIGADGVDNDEDGVVDDLHGWDFVTGAAEPKGDDHGTAVAALAARGTPQLEIMGLRAFDPSKPERIAAAIDYAGKKGVRVLNLSARVTGAVETKIVRAAIERNPQVLIVKSAGNRGQSGTPPNDRYTPDQADEYLVAKVLPNMICVSEATFEDKKSAISLIAPNGIAARSSHVLTAIAGSASATEGYGQVFGTSFAAPQVANAAAKCLLLDPTLSPAQLVKLLRLTSSPLSWGAPDVSGLVDPDAAMKIAAARAQIRAKVAPTKALASVGLSGQAATKARSVLVALG